MHIIQTAFNEFNEILYHIEEVIEALTLYGDCNDSQTSKKTFSRGVKLLLVLMLIKLLLILYFLFLMLMVITN